MTHKQCGRILTATENILAEYLDNEAQALALAPHVTLPENPTSDQIDAAIAEVLVEALRSAQGETAVVVEYIGGIRRDTLRV